jgi:hypothetical protein
LNLKNALEPINIPFVLSKISPLRAHGVTLKKSLGPSYLDPDTTSQLSDSASFTPQSNIWVSKNILVWATASDEAAELNGFNQRFSLRTAQVIPEPGTLLLLVTSVVASLVSRYRYFNAAQHGKTA